MSIMDNMIQQQTVMRTLILVINEMVNTPDNDTVYFGGMGWKKWHVTI